MALKPTTFALFLALLSLLFVCKLVGGLGDYVLIAFASLGALHLAHALTDD